MSRTHATLLCLALPAATCLLACGGGPTPPAPPAATSPEGKSAMTLAAYLAQRPDGPTVVSCKGRMERVPGAGKDFWLGLTPARSDPWASESIRVREDHPAHAALFAALKDGAGHDMLLELRLAPNDVGRVAPELVRVVEIPG